MTLTIWISSFIPRDIAGYTVQIPGGAGTAIPGPSPISDCFLTDQRGFAATRTASARMRSLAEIDPARMTLVGQDHHADATVECDCEDGEVECSEAASTAGLTVTGFTSSAGRCSFRFHGAAGNPCFAGAPAIDWRIDVEVSREGANTVVEVKPTSRIEPFPAFEMYAALGGATKALFREMPNPGTTPWNLVGPPNKPVSGRVSFP